MRVNVTQTSATVAWVVQSGQTSLGVVPGKLDKVAPVLRTEKVSYAGLVPGSTYYYDVLGGRPEGKGSFRTAPNGDVPFEFLVYGDTRTRHDVHRKVIATMLAHSSPEFALQSGDLVENGMDSVQWPVYFDIEREWLRKVSFFPMVGNHERNDHQFFDFFNAKPYYAFDWGGSHFMVIDSDIATASSISDGSAAFWAEETRWLEEELQASQGAPPPCSFVDRASWTDLGASPDAAPCGAHDSVNADARKVQGYRGLLRSRCNCQHCTQGGALRDLGRAAGALLDNVSKPPAGIKPEKFAMIRGFPGGQGLRRRRLHVNAIVYAGPSSRASMSGK